MDWLLVVEYAEIVIDGMIGGTRQGIRVIYLA